MNISKKFGIGIASVALVGGLAFSPSASAAGEDGGAGGARIAKVCARIDNINHHLERVANRTAKATERLTAKRAEAEAAGKTEAVERIDKALARIEERAAKAMARLDRVNAWAAEHCTTTG